MATTAWASIPSGGLLGFGGWRCETAAAAAQALAKEFALFGGHLLPALEVLATPSSAAIAAMPAETAEENAAKDQQTQRLPSEERRQQPVPKMHDQFAEERHKAGDGQRRDNKNPGVSFHPFVSHFL